MSETEAVVPQPPWQTFGSALLTRIAFISVAVVLGAMNIYMCKVAQSNILPACSVTTPYTNYASAKEVDIAAVPDPFIQDINIVYVDYFSPKQTYSTKIFFPVDDNTANYEMWLRPLMNGINGKQSTPWSNYMSSIQISMLSTNIGFYNTFFQWVNSTFSESIILILSPLMVVIYILVLIANMMGFSFLLFWNIGLFFWDKNGDDGWTEPAEYSSEQLGKYWGMVLCVAVFFMFFSLFPAIIFGLIYTVKGLNYIMYSQAVLYDSKQQNNKGKPYSFIANLKDTIKYKLSIIMYIISFYLVQDVKEAFGVSATVFVAIVMVLLWKFGSPYHQYVPDSGDDATLLAPGSFLNFKTRLIQPCVQGEKVTPGAKGNPSPSAPPMDQEAKTDLQKQALDIINSAKCDPQNGKNAEGCGKALGEIVDDTGDPASTVKLLQELVPFVSSYFMKDSEILTAVEKNVYEQVLTARLVRFAIASKDKAAYDESVSAFNEDVTKGFKRYKIPEFPELPNKVFKNVEDTKQLIDKAIEQCSSQDIINDSGKDAMMDIIKPVVDQFMGSQTEMKDLISIQVKQNNPDIENVLTIVLSVIERIYKDKTETPQLTSYSTGSTGSIELNTDSVEANVGSTGSVEPNTGIDTTGGDNTGGDNTGGDNTGGVEPNTFTNDSNVTFSKDAE